MVDNFDGYNVLFAILGGVLIALSTSINLYLKGRITGMSGIFYSLITYDNTFFQKIGVLAGILFSSSVLWLIFLDHIVAGKSVRFFDQTIAQIANLNMVGFGIASVLVGFGTKTGNGCTSGHGVCGLPRWSIRSWIAVPCFMGFGIAIATLRYYEPFLDETQGQSIAVKTAVRTTGYIILAISIAISVATMVYFKIKKSTRAQFFDHFIQFVVGVLFTTGLALGGMLQRSKILGFLQLNKHWDPQLLILFLSAVGTNIITFHFILKKNTKPVYSEKFMVPTNKNIDVKLILGTAIFGIGWGIGGICPGPVLSLFPQFTIQVGLIFVVGLAVGQLLSVLADKYIFATPPQTKQIKVDQDKALISPTTEKVADHQVKQVDQQVKQP